MKQNKIMVGIIALIALVFFVNLLVPSGKVDNWKYSGGGGMDSFGTVVQSIGGGIMSKSGSFAAEASMGGSIGFSAGGAKDINNFRENIENGYFPMLTDITYEGLFYDYYFETGQEDKCDELFCPSYSYAISKDPFSGEDEYYLSVGLNSGIKESDFARKKLNLIVVLDISGSMTSSFDRYYYDQFGNEVINEEEMRKSKMEVAKEAIVDLLGHLEDDDRFGMVLFDDSAYLAKPMSKVSDTDMGAIEDHIMELSPQGGTNMESGMKMGTQQFKELLFVDTTEYENRIIFLTDAMPNTGRVDKDSLIGMAKDNADDKIFTTFIGIGVDFNTELIEHMTKIKGANYYSVHNSKEFKERMDEGFEYMVTPLVFDLKLVLEADGYEIEKVYGSPEADEATGEIMKVNTLFPSKSEDGEVKGGIVVLKLKKTSASGELKLKVSYEDREGNKESDEKEVEFGDSDADYFQNKGIRKGVLLARYANLMKNWIYDERNERVVFNPTVNSDDGIVVPEFSMLGRWERQSVDLKVSNSYEELFEEFIEYFEEEMEEIGDDSLKKEVEVMGRLVGE